MFDFGNTDTVVTIGIVYSVTVVIATWLAMVVWAYRDMRSRSRDSFAQLLVGVMVAVLTIPGLLIYVFLRPKETLGEAYERSLEEEALLQEIEEKPSCPGCGQRVQDEWQVCAYCHTRLKKVCFKCNYLLELPWQICPQCATPQREYAPDLQVQASTPHTHQTNVPEPRISLTRQSQSSRTRGQDLEFIDGEEF